MQQAIFDHFTPNGWAVLEEVSCDDANPDTGKWCGMRRIDALALRTPKVTRVAGVDLSAMHVMALEIKVSRADFLADVRDEAKQRAWRALAHQHAYVVPQGLVSAQEVPPGCGLLAVTGFNIARDGVAAAVWERRAPYSAGGLPASFMRSFAFRAAVAEAKVRGRTGRGRGDDVEELRARLLRTQRELDKERASRARHEADARGWRKVASMGGRRIDCAQCGQAIALTRRGVAAWSESWRHVDVAREAPCQAARVAAEIARRAERPQGRLSAEDVRACLLPVSPAQRSPQV